VTRPKPMRFCSEYILVGYLFELPNVHRRNGVALGPDRFLSFMRTKDFIEEKCGGARS
jgi:hypothetical protein